MQNFHYKMSSVDYTNQQMAASQLDKTTKMFLWRVKKIAVESLHLVARMRWSDWLGNYIFQWTLHLWRVLANDDICLIQGRARPSLHVREVSLIGQGSSKDYLSYNNQDGVILVFILFTAVLKLTKGATENPVHCVIQEHRVW